VTDVGEEVLVGIHLRLRPVNRFGRWFIEWWTLDPSLDKDIEAWHRFKRKRASGKEAGGHYYFDDPVAVIAEFKAKREARRAKEVKAK
jgi:hypothetical protein